MPGLGTLVNIGFIIIGGLAGVLFGNRLSEKSRETLMLANAVSVLFIGIAGALQQMFVLAEDGKLQSSGTMMLIASLAIGAVLGEWIDLEERIERFGEWLKEKSGNAGDTGFVNAFVTASLTVCVGAMAIVGSIEDGAAGNHSILFAKAVLDLIIVMVMAASLGKGCIFAAIPVGLLQGCVTALSVLIRPYITDQAMAYLSLVGSVLIFCVGVNLFWGKKIRVANLLPALIVAVIWAASGTAYAGEVLQETKAGEAAESLSEAATEETSESLLETETGEMAKYLSGEVLDCAFDLNESTGWSVFHITSRLTNEQAPLGIMQIHYVLTLLDGDGHRMEEIARTWNGQDAPLPPGGTVEDLAAGQVKVDGEVAEVRLSVLSALTEEEMPPVHVPKAGEYLYQALDNAHVQNIGTEPPVQFNLWIDRGGARSEGEVTDPETVRRLTDAFMKIRIREETGESVTDNYNGFSMVFADGETYTVSLNLYNLEYSIYRICHIFELDEFGEFWALMGELTEPAEYGGDS